MIISDGISQARRYPAAFVSGYFDVDERSFESLLGYCSELADNLKFVDLDNEAHGKWSELFLSSEVFVLAAIMAVDVESLDRTYLRRVRHSGPGAAMDMIAEIAQTVDSWHKLLQRRFPGSDQILGSRVADLIKRQLVEDLHSAADRFAEQGSIGDDASRSFAAMAPEWELGAAPEDAGFARSAYREEKTKEAASDFYRARFYSFVKAIAYIQNVAATNWRSALARRDIDPALGLVIAFVKLFGRIQQRLNRFTSRHRRYYYDEIIGVERASARPDRADILLQPDGPETRVLVPAGTRFDAGKDADGNDRIFESKGDVLVRDFRVASLRTLAFARDQRKSPERDLGYVTGVGCRSTEFRGGGGDASELNWPVLGGSTDDVREPAELHGDLGFALASPQLLLGEGERRISITVHLDAPGDIQTQLSVLGCTNSADRARRQLGRLFARYLLAPAGPSADKIREGIRDWVSNGDAVNLIGADSVKLIVDYLDMDHRSLFYFLLQDSLAVTATAADGWHAVRDLRMTPQSSSASRASVALRFDCLLDGRAPSIVAYDAEIHGEGWHTDHPIVAFRVNPQTHFCPISAFLELTLCRVSLDVEVLGVRQLTASSKDGPVDVTSAFPAFGAVPADGSHLTIGCPELSNKVPSSIDVDFEWAGLPRAQGGLEKQYADYQGAYRDTDFRATVVVLDDGDQPMEFGAESDSVPIFEIDPATGISKPTVSIPIAGIDRWRREGSYATARSNRDACHISLTLRCPEEAFGQAEYPVLMATVLAKNAKRKKALPIPPEPYLPTLRRLSLNYCASSHVELADPATAASNESGDAVFHIHPFGVERLDPETASSPISLLPSYGYDGNLLIGVEAKDAAGPLSFYVDLHESSRQSLKRLPVPPKWSYLAGDEWHSLSDRRISVDSTSGLRKSGVVMVDVPEDADMAHRSLPSGYFWLRASTRTASPGFGRLRGVQVNAVHVIQSISADAPGEPAALAPGTIRDTVGVVPGLAGVKQPAPSYGGRPRESVQSVDSRVSERLRHKNRAVTPWDYERLVLSRFPSVFKAKCFSAMGNVEPESPADDPPPRPGEVLIVVVPSPDGKMRADGGLPRLNVAELEDIRSFAQDLAPTVAKIHVRNPTYERLQVRCSVRFNDADTSGLRARRLNEAICDYLSPWTGQAQNARFGWRFRCQDVESFIRDLDFVDYVAGLSILHVSEDDRTRFFLEDTEREAGGATGRFTEPRVPWGLAVPFDTHHIRVLRDVEPVQAAPVGIGELEVGRTMIL